MTCKEFSDRFDVLLNSHANLAEFGEQTSVRDIVLDEYEKSQFLTKAQEELVLGYYTGRNQTGDTFEHSEEIRRYMSSLIQTEEILPDENQTFHITLSGKSKIFSLPKDLWFITYESIVLDDKAGPCIAGKILKVIPTTQDELSNTLENPFKGPSKRRGLRLDLPDNKVEIISLYSIKKYIVRYLKTLSPIVLETLPDGLKVNEVAQKTECTLNPALHEAILELAVKMALQSRMIVRAGGK